MPTLAEALYILPAERLRALAALRQVDPKRLALASDKRQLVQLMATELNTPPSLARAIMSCNARELRLLQLMLATETKQAVSWRSVVEAAGGASLERPLGEVLAGLERLGLALRSGDTVHLPDMVRHQVPTSLSDHYTLSGCLNGYDAQTLKQIARRLGTAGDTKADCVVAIAHRLLSVNKGVTGALPIDPEEQEVLDYLIQSGGGATAIEVAGAVLGGTDDFFRYDWQNRWKAGKEKNAIDRLLARGLIYVVSYSYGFNLYLVIPGDLLRVLTGESGAAFWTSPAPRPAVQATPPPVTLRQSPPIRDVVALFGYVSTQEAVRTNTGYIHKGSLKNIARLLSFPDERYAAFVYAICRECGLIAPQGDKHAYGVTPKGMDWLNLDAREQLRALFVGWRKGEFWAEMFSEPLKRSNEYREQGAVVSVRDAVLDVIAINPDAGFVDISSLADALGFRFPLLLTRSAQHGADLVPSPTNYVHLLIGESLYWLGLVELGWNAAPAGLAGIPAAGRVPGAPRGYPAPGEERTPASALPDSYRLTPEGAYLFDIPGAAPPGETPTETQFIVQANSEIFLPPYLETATHFHLLLITETPGKGASGNVVSLTRESIRRALDQGITGREMLEFLRSHARTAIPQNVEYLIDEVSGKHGHIHIGRAQMYLQVDSPLVLKELQARRELKGYFVRTLGDTVAILNAPEPDKLLKELRKAGYLPISDDAPKGEGFRLGARKAAKDRTTAASASSKTGKTASNDRDSRQLGSDRQSRRTQLARDERGGRSGNEADRRRAR